MIIVLFAGERIFRIGTLLVKLQAKWFGCFTCPVCSALSCLKVQISPDNLRMMDNICYSLLLFLKQSNSDFSINKYEDAIDQFDILTDRLTLSVTD